MKHTKLTALALAGATALSLISGVSPAFAAAGTVTTGNSFSVNSDSKTGSGDMELIYDTSKGEGSGVVTITIPTSVTFNNVPAGKINLSQDYKVNVKGIIKPDEAVTVKTEPKKAQNQVAISITQEKEKWTADECFGTATDAGYTGTDATDVVNANGTIKTKGTVTDYVTYTASIQTQKIEVSKALPTKSGQVVAMNIRDFNQALGGYILSNGWTSVPNEGSDPTNPRYYIYAINNTPGTNDSKLSTPENFNKIGATFFSQKPTPTNNSQHWTNVNNSGYSVMGGPFNSIENVNHGTFCFCWYDGVSQSSTYSSRCCDGRYHVMSNSNEYWNANVDYNNVYVIIVHA